MVDCGTIRNANEIVVAVYFIWLSGIGMNSFSATFAHASSTLWPAAIDPICNELLSPFESLARIKKR